MQRKCRSPVPATLCALLAVGMAPALAQSGAKPDERGGPPPDNSCSELVGGANFWRICDDEITTNGQPAGGNCSVGAAGGGAAIDDASAFSRGDAFDRGGMFWINGTQVGGVASYGSTSAVFAAQAIAGLTTQLRYDALTSEPTLRAFLRLTNPGATPVTVTVDYATNFGSDNDTVVNGTSSGDTLFTPSDRWVVTSDGGPGDAVNTTVLYSGTPAIAPSSVSGTVFDCYGPQGARATYSVTVPPGQKVALVTFQRLGDNIADALAAAAAYSVIAAGSPLLAGLTPGDIAAIVNRGEPCAATRARSGRAARVGAPVR